jgi:hypothetical protein
LGLKYFKPNPLKPKNIAKTMQDSTSGANCQY